MTLGYTYPVYLVDVKPQEIQCFTTKSTTAECKGNVWKKLI